MAVLFGQSILSQPQEVDFVMGAGIYFHFSHLSVSQFSRSVVSDSLRPHGLQHARLPCPSPTLRACSNLCPLSRWCHPTISSSVLLLLPSIFPSIRVFPMSQFFAAGDQRIGVSASASVLPMNIQGWFSWGLTDLISLLSKGDLRVFFSTAIWKHQILQCLAFFIVQLSYPYMTIEKTIALTI